MFRALFTGLTSSRYATKSNTFLRTSRWNATREFRTTVGRQRTYKRFSDPPGSQNSPKNPLDWRRWDPPVKFGVALLTVTGGYYVAHLEQVPETGRWRFMNVSTQMEAQLGEMMREQTRSELKDQILPLDHPLSIHVRRVTSRILRYSNLGRIRGEPPAPEQPMLDGLWTSEDDHRATTQDAYGAEKEWDVVVINDKRMVNAAASPGIIIVYTGLLPVCKDEQGLAAVISHEISHVVARHSAEAISSRTVMFAVLFALQLLGIDWGFSQFVDKYLFQLPNSRTQELEADLIGLRLMSRACYDPKASPEMFERLGKISGQSNVDFLATHPSSARRVKQVEEALPHAYSILEANPECIAMQDKLDRFRDHTRAIRIDHHGNTEFV